MRPLAVLRQVDNRELMRSERDQCFYVTGPLCARRGNTQRRVLAIRCGARLILMRSSMSVPLRDETQTGRDGAHTGLLAHPVPGRLDDCAQVLLLGAPSQFLLDLFRTRNQHRRVS